MAANPASDDNDRVLKRTGFFKRALSDSNQILDCDAMETRRQAGSADENLLRDSPAKREGNHDAVYAYRIVSSIA